MTNKQTTLAFIDRINAQDVEGLAALMSDDHTFIDAHGNQVSGKEKMIAGWHGYFSMFPDYYIEVTEVFEDGGETGAVWFRRRFFPAQRIRKLALTRSLESRSERRSRDSVASLCRYEDSV